MPFPESFGLVTLKSISFGSAGVVSWHPSFKLMETVLTSVGIAVASLVRKIFLTLFCFLNGNYI